tara:strand:+ start:496 stop:765 length:270 start_codon:yes stop_codon:yes gene_type:complete
LEQRLEDNEINFTDKLHELSLQIERLTEDNMVLNNLKYASNREISDTYPPGLMDPHTKKNTRYIPKSVSAKSPKTPPPQNNNTWITVRR